MTKTKGTITLPRGNDALVEMVWNTIKELDPQERCLVIKTAIHIMRTTEWDSPNCMMSELMHTVTNHTLLPVLGLIGEDLSTDGEDIVDVTKVVVSKNVIKINYVTAPILRRSKSIELEECSKFAGKSVLINLTSYGSLVFTVLFGNASSAEDLQTVAACAVVDFVTERFEQGEYVIVESIKFTDKGYDLVYVTTAKE